MGIYIKGMEMPKNCRACRFAGFGGIRCELNVCMFTGESQPTLSPERMSNCPLFPVSEHGRLIDADALMHDTDSFVHKTMVFGGQYVYSEDAIKNAPTIIEAEEGE